MRGDIGRIAAALIAFTLAAMAAHAEAAVDAAGIATQGNGRGAAPCIACHGVDGGGQAEAGNPRLAGLDAAYLEKELDDFADGTRESAVMQATAKALDANERHALAAYYGRLPIPAALAHPTAPPPAASAPGARLALRGDWSRDIPGCVQCHGPDGSGVGAHFPPLAGQPAAYLETQLRAWQAGTRRNDPLELMRHLSSALTADEIRTVSAWFAGQAVTATGGQP